jgi:hypothetical protein
MSTSELGEVEALLQRVLPDPRGFAERVFEQMMERLTREVPDASTTVVNGYDTEAHEALVDRNTMLAAAVGACDCWGFEPDCTMCGGAGSAGWTRPDAELFTEFVEPAVRRMSAPSGEETEEAAQSEEGKCA